jgi:hypothetical protein
MTRRYEPAPGIIETDLGSELILLDPGTQEMFSLNVTGRAVWRGLIRSGIAGADQELAAFDAPSAVAEADARVLLDALVAAGLVREAQDLDGA